MAIESNQLAKIVSITDQYWAKHVQKEAFAELISGKEPGHRMADYVDDQTTALLKIAMDTRQEANRKGAPKKRSMGDVWVRSNGIFNPVNIKAGLQDMGGQPNLVSMQKLLDYIFQRKIDSYYLLIIKFDIGNRIAHKTYLIDLLDWTDFVTYDAGPGQIMLREKEFYRAFEGGKAPRERAIAEKVEILFKRFEEGVQALFSNRKGRLDRQRRLLVDFPKKGFRVDQANMYFVP